MDPAEAEAEIRRLEALILRHEALYRSAVPEISDAEFDDMMHRLEALERAYPQFASDKSPTRRVGDDSSDGFRKVGHLAPMLSLDNTFSPEELEEFDARLRRFLNTDELLTYTVEPKIDGCGISAVYEDGVLSRLLTRGDGRQGDDITKNLYLFCGAIPLRLKGNFPGLLEVRGEAYMTRAEFGRILEAKRVQFERKTDAEISKQKKKLSDLLPGETEQRQIIQKKIESLEDARQKAKRMYANPRNLTAGTLKLLERPEEERRLNAAFYSLGEVSGEGAVLHRQSELRGLLESWGLPNINWNMQAKGIGKVLEAIELLDEKRKSFGFDTDGAVVKLDDVSLQLRAGFTSKAPRWAIAWKYRAQRVSTILRAITLQVGRTGAVTPVAELDPVEISGSVVSRATLHNADEIARKDIRVGDCVIVEKAGEIIPAVVGVEIDKRPPDSKPYVFADKCPICSTPLVRPNGEVVYRCPNIGCPAQIEQRLVHFASRKCMDIDGMGEKVALALCKLGMVKYPADIYSLKVSDFLKIDGFALKSAENLAAAIEKSKDVDLWRLIFALGIFDVGESAAKDFARTFGSLDAFASASKEELMQIEGVGEKMSDSVREFFESPHNVETIEALRGAGVNFSKAQVAVGRDTVFSGKSCVFTGTLSSMGRNEAKALLERLGARISSDVSKKTDFLICGQGGGSKLKRAEQFGVKTLSEEEFLKMAAAKDETALAKDDSKENVREPKKGANTTEDKLSDSGNNVGKSNGGKPKDRANNSSGAEQLELF